MYKRDYAELSVLVVDDSEPMQKLLAVLLTNYGATEIKQADDGISALAILKERRFDLIITDMAMRGMDGLEFSRRLRRPDSKVPPEIPVLMITSHSDLPTIKAALDAGVSEYLIKPLSSKPFYERLDQVLQRKGAVVSTQTYKGPNRRRLGSRGVSPRRRAAD
jgi:PleD family two-component response regulator